MEIANDRSKYGAVQLQIPYHYEGYAIDLLYLSDMVSWNKNMTG